MNRQIFIGFDPREAAAFAVARDSIRRHLTQRIPITGLVLSDLREHGYYRRPTEIRDGRLWDVISEAPMSTQFSISRFLVPYLANDGWALFIDCDFLARGDVSKLFDLADTSKAVMVVKHDYRPTETTKMDGQVQTAYPRKNWSSACLFNVRSPANAGLTVDYVNSVPGRELHRFGWLSDEDIGELHPRWNYLVGHTKDVKNPVLVHFTEGLPIQAGYESCEYADEWRDELTRWAR